MISQNVTKNPHFLVCFVTRKYSLTSASVILNGIVSLSTFHEILVPRIVIIVLPFEWRKAFSRPWDASGKTSNPLINSYSPTSSFDQNVRKIRREFMDHWWQVMVDLGRLMTWDSLDKGFYMFYPFPGVVMIIGNSGMLHCNVQHTKNLENIE